MDKPDSASEVEAIFRPRRTERLYAVLCLAGGIAAFGVAAVGFVAALAMRVNQFSLHSLTTLPALYRGQGR